MAGFSQDDYQQAITAGIDTGDNDPLSITGAAEGDEDLDDNLEDEVEDTTDDDITDDELGDDDQSALQGQTKAPKNTNGLYDKQSVQKIVRTRVATYQKKMEKMAPFKSAVDKICEITGLDPDSLVGRLEAMTDDEQAKILGMNVNQVRQARQARSQLQATEGKTRSLQREMDITKLKADARFADYDLFKEEIEDMLDDNPKLSVKQAYLAVKGDMALTSSAREAEQRTVEKSVIARQKGLVKPGSAGQNRATPKLSNDILMAARKVGMDPAEYAKYQGVDNLDSFRASRKKK